MKRQSIAAALPPAALAAAILIAAAFRDGYFRDELYYLACARRLAWGYVDHPPLVAVILRIVTSILGESLVVLRAVAAAAAVATVWTTGSLARRLGASPFGQGLAMTAAALAPALLGVATFYSMNVFDVLLWTLAARVLLDALDEPGDRRWLALGLVLGVGLLNKMSVLWLGAGLAAGLLLTPQRALLRTRGPWLTAALAGLIFAPHVLWQVRRGWPTLEFIREASRGKMLENTPLAFALDQVMTMHPVTVWLWGAGLLALGFASAFRRYRVLAVAYVTVFLILVSNRTSRSSYLLPVYPMLLAAGAAWWDTRLRRPIWRAAAIAVVALGCAITVPLAVPLLSTDRYVRYASALGLAPDTEEKHDLGRLPQFFADRQGWPAIVDQIAAVRDSLEPSERVRAVVLTGNYGEAGAIETLGRSRGLRAISGHNNYWIWGPDDAGDPMIAVGLSRGRLERAFDHVEERGRTSCGDCMPYEHDQPIFLCRGLRAPLAESWRSFKHFN